MYVCIHIHICISTHIKINSSKYCASIISIPSREDVQCSSPSLTVVTIKNCTMSGRVRADASAQLTSLLHTVSLPASDLSYDDCISLSLGAMVHCLGRHQHDRRLRTLALEPQTLVELYGNIIIVFNEDINQEILLQQLVGQCQGANRSQAPATMLRQRDGVAYLPEFGNANPRH